MPLWRLQCQFGADTPFPRDRMVMTPHFNDTLPGSDPQGLCDDLVAGLNTWDNGTREIRVTAYDAQGTPPVFPVAEAVVNESAFPPSSGNREVALCLSFYAGTNRPRNRGRLYIPATLASIGVGAARPTNANMQKVADLVPLFTGLGGTDVDWCVYSRVDNQPRSISHWWVDNAWDIQRSRGLAADARLEGDVSE